MALPKAMKRAAASPARGNEKKKLLKRSVGVAKALMQSDMPADAKNMLREAAGSALSMYADERHPFQAKIVSMAEKAFNEIEANLQAAVGAVQQRIESLDEGKLQDAVMRQAQVLAQLKSAVANKEADEMEARMKLPSINERLKSVQKEVLSGDLEHGDTLKAKGRLDCILHVVEKMKAEPLVKKGATKAIADLTALGVDASLLATLHGVITKPVEERGEFDALTLSNLEAELAAKHKEVDAKLSELEPARVQREALVGAAQEAHDIAQERLNSARSALEEAKAAAENGRDQLKADELELKNYAQNLKAAQEKLKAAERKLVDFQCGALQSFRSIQSACRPSVSEPIQANPEV